MHAIGLPVSASAIEIKRGGESYSLLLDTDTFDRAGEDGDMPIIPLSGGSEFVGEVLCGDFHKGWEVGISAFTATIDSGILRMTGVATAPGTGKSGWINSYHLVPMLDELEVTVAMEVPVDITGAPNRDIQYEFYLKQDKDELNPSTDNNYFCIYTNVDDATGLRLFITKNVLGAGAVTLASGKDYLMAADRGVGNLEATIWRFVFNGKPGTAGATLSIYLKQSDTLANAETATENEIVGSPFDVSDWAFNIGYPSYRIWTENGTYFGTAYDSADRAESTYLRVTYPSQFGINYNYTEANYGESDVELWDGDPALATSQRVYDEDHEFSGDPYIQNGLQRLHIDEGQLNGLKFYYYDGATWDRYTEVFRSTLVTDVQDLDYAFFSKILRVSPETVSVEVFAKDSAVDDDNQYVKYEITLERGHYAFKIKSTEVFPVQNLRIFLFLTGGNRFWYVGNGAVGDLDISQSGTNTTKTDNFIVGLDDDGDQRIVFLSTNVDPDAGTDQFHSFQGLYGNFREYDSVDTSSIEMWLSAFPFSLVANLFEEAEDATLGGGAGTVTDGAASPLLGANNAVQLNLAGENVYWDFTAGTNLPAGRYIAFIRAREVDDEDMDVSVINDPLGAPSYRNEENATVTFALGVTFAYYGVVFDITDADVAGTDAMRILVEKADADADEIRIDYFLIVPIGNGEDWSQDLAHGALRDVTPHRRLCER